MVHPPFFHNYKTLHINQNIRIRMGGCYQNGSDGRSQMGRYHSTLLGHEAEIEAVVRPNLSVVRHTHGAGLAAKRVDGHLQADA